MTFKLPAGAHNAAAYPIVPVMWLFMAQQMIRTLAGAAVAIDSLSRCKATSPLDSSCLASSWPLDAS